MKDSLTPMQQACLLHVAHGATADEAGAAMGKHRETIKLHLGNARKHYGVKTTAAAVACAVSRGDIDYKETIGELNMAINVDQTDFDEMVAQARDIVRKAMGTDGA